MSGYVDPAKARVPLREKRAHKKLRLDSRNMEITVEKSLRGRSIELKYTILSKSIKLLFY